VEILTPLMSRTEYLNVDLDIYSRSDLQPLIDALGEKVFVLHAGRDNRTYLAHLELARTYRGPDAAIRAYCSLVQRLPAPARRLWNRAFRRDFHIGVQAGTAPHAWELAVQAETLRLAAASGARIVFTVYTLEPGVRPKADAPSRTSTRRTPPTPRTPAKAKE
jgi:hypothetical protein